MTGCVRVCVRVSGYEHRSLCAGVRVIEFGCAWVCVYVCVRVRVRESVSVWLPECV